MQCYIRVQKTDKKGVATGEAEVLPAEKKWNNDVINSNNRILGLPETKLVESGTLH